MAKEKLLVVTERFFPEEFLINDLVIELQKNFDIEVLTQMPSYPFDKLYSGFKNKIFSIDCYKGIKVHRVYTKLGYKKNIKIKIFGYIVFALLTWVKAFTIGRRGSKVFFYHTGPATMAHSVFVFKKIFRNECFIWTQDVWPEAIFASGIKETNFRRKILEYYLEKLYNNFDKVMVSCKGFIPIIKQYYYKNIIHISQWYSDGERLNTPNIIEDAIQYTFLGNIGSVQNLENVCKGFQKAIQKGLCGKLNIVGDGVLLNNLKSMFEEINSGEIIFWGRRPAVEMSDFISKSNVMVISLKDDPLFSLYVPAKFQGYTSGGRPIFGIIRGEVAAIINENAIGYVSDPSDIESIAEGFLYFSENTELLSLMGVRSREYYNEHFDRNTCIESLISEISN